MRSLRAGRGWTLDELAGRSGVSRATLSRLESAEVSPTTAALSRLCTAYGLAVSHFMHMAEGEFQALVERGSQPLWASPETEFERRSVSPPDAALAGEVQECRLGPASRIDIAASTRGGMEHHLLLVFGRLEVTLDGAAQLLMPGDCLRYRPAGPMALETPTDSAARFYLFMV